ncbi:hypothetical protein Scep_030047 [Stephania cephalantha]|uniref:Uncharacterized protein n=1 Tax=Stephania cephalantha TaxID=152367 RepID=A0AAP0DYY6_9MAGN
MAIEAATMEAKGGTGAWAAKEFESELKKEPDLAIESPPAEKPVAISEEKKPETKVPSTEENL